MKSVKFSASPGRKWMAALTYLPLLGIAAFLAYESIADLQTITLSADNWLDVVSGMTAVKGVLAVAGLSLAPPLIIASYWLNVPKRNFLRLDQDGFRYVRAGKSRHWHWSALPVFTTVLKNRQIRFVLPEGDTDPKQRDRWVHEVTPDGPVVAIQDIYDAPLDEIAAVLNRYRAQEADGEATP